MNTKPAFLLKSTALMVAVALFYCPTLPAQEVYWRGTTSEDWSEGSNWSTESPPTQEDLIIFSDSAQTAVFHDSAPFTEVLGLRFDGPAPSYTITGNGLALRSKGIQVYSANTQTLGIDVRLASTSIFHIARGELHVAGALSNTSSGTASGLTKSGAGTLRLSGANTYSGTTRLNAGITLLDFATQRSNIINPLSSLLLGGGDLTLHNASGGSSASQTLNGVTFARGSGTKITFTGGGTQTLDLGTTWNREGNSGSTLTVDISQGGRLLTSGLASQTTHDTHTEVLGYVLVKDNEGIGFGFVQNGEFKRYSAAATLASSTTNDANLNVRTSGDLTLSGNKYFQSLELDTRLGEGSLTLSADSNYIRLARKAILMVGEHDFAIHNGQIGERNQELNIHQQGSGLLTISGRLGDGSTRFSKSGTGTLLLTTENSYTGATVIQEGTLWLEGSLSGTSAVTIAGSAQLKGGGKINTTAELLIQAGATLAPGQSIGRFESGTTVFEGEARFQLEIRAAGTDGSPGEDWDQHAITGFLDLRQLNAEERLIIDLVTLNNIGDYASLDAWDESSDYVWRAFITASNGMRGNFDASLFEINTEAFQNTISGTFSVVLGEDGKSLDLVYHSIPEPSSYALISLAVVGLLRQCWRRGHVGAKEY